MDDFPGSSPSNYLFADPDSYMVKYKCDEMFDGGMHAHYIMIMSRSTEMSADQLATIKADITEKIPSYDSSWFNMHVTAQKDCQYDWTL